MVCRNICERLCSKIIVGRRPYQDGKKYCRRCEVYFYQVDKFCQCCDVTSDHLRPLTVLCNLSIAVTRYDSSWSIPMNVLFSFNALTPVVPIPIKDRLRSNSEVKFEIHRTHGHASLSRSH
jgi:hypothetical protein